MQIFEARTPGEFDETFKAIVHNRQPIMLGPGDPADPGDGLGSDGEVEREPDGRSQVGQIAFTAPHLLPDARAETTGTSRYGHCNHSP